MSNQVPTAPNCRYGHGGLAGIGLGSSVPDRTTGVQGLPVRTWVCPVCGYVELRTDPKVAQSSA